MSGNLHLTGDLDMFMSVPSCFTCHNKISWRCSFSFLMRHLFRYALAVTSIEKAECLQCALQSDSFTEINKYPERKSDFKSVVYFVKGARSERKKKAITPPSDRAVTVAILPWNCFFFFFFFKTYIVMY